MLNPETDESIFDPGSFMRGREKTVSPSSAAWSLGDSYLGEEECAEELSHRKWKKATVQNRMECIKPSPQVVALD